MVWISDILVINKNQDWVAAGPQRIMHKNPSDTRSMVQERFIKER